MADFGQFPDNPFVDPLDHSLNDPLADSFDPSLDRFEAIPDALSSPVPESFGVIEPPAAADSQELPADRDSPYMEDLARMLGLGEDHIENSPPIPPALQPDALESLRSDLEDNIESAPESFQNSAEVELHQDPAWWYSAPAVGTPPPPPGICDHPEIRPIRGDQPIRQQRGTSRTKMSAEDKTWCPLEDDYIPAEACEDKECQYYDYEVKRCAHHDNRQ